MDMHDTPTAGAQEHAKKFRLPSKKDLAEYDTAAADLEAERSKLNQRGRDLAARYTIDRHVHSDAFALAQRLKSMSPVDRNAFLKHFAHYVETFRLDAQADFFDASLQGKIAVLADHAAKLAGRS